jgi:hypothetical protein
MSLPRGSLGFLNEKGEPPRGSGRGRDRLRRGCPDGGQFAVSHSKGNDRERNPDAQPHSHTECKPPTLASSAGHVPWRRQRGTDVPDELSVDDRADPL